MGHAQHVSLVSSVLSVTSAADSGWCYFGVMLYCAEVAAQHKAVDIVVKHVQMFYNTWFKGSV